MWRKSLSGIILALAAAAPAQADTLWNFSYTGFYSVQTGVFEPRWVESGHFRGEDVNLDGILSRSELTEFRWSFLDYLPGTGGYCGNGFFCELQQFSYTMDGQLNFSTHWRYSDESPGRGSESGTVAGSEIWHASIGPGGSSLSRTLWTSATRFDITPPPVPEPAGGPMLLLGMLGLAAAKAWQVLRPQGRTRK